MDFLGTVKNWSCDRAPVSKFLIGFLLTFQLLHGGGPAWARELKASFSFNGRSTFKMNGRAFDLTTPDGINKLAISVDQLLVEYSRATNRAPSNKSLSKKDVRGLKVISHLAQTYAKEPLTARRAMLQRQILEVAAAIANNHRSPVPSYVGLPDLPFRFAAAISNPVAHGRKNPSNISPGPGVDPSIVDPHESTYWQRPASIATEDLYSGFGRATLPDFERDVWTYKGPKKTGANPGCELVSGNRRIRVKFAEVHSEPFISRIFHALGYHVDPTDYVSHLKVRYDRRFLTEFNRRTPIEMKIGIFFIPIHTFHFEDTYDPFAYIQYAILKDGKRISAADLKNALLLDPGQKQKDCSSKSFQTEFEKEIDYLVTTEANVQMEHEGTKSIGPWGFAGLGREHLREVRGAGVLAAWVGWWDSRFDNTGLRVVETSAGTELRHFFTDLGSGLGRSGGTFRHSSEEPDDFPWSFTKGKNVRRNGATQWKFAITNFEPITETPAFKEITLEDARWMARLIGQLSEEQIAGALKASGFDSTEVGIYTRKLVARRDKLIQDVRLESEFRPLRNADTGTYPYEQELP